MTSVRLAHSRFCKGKPVSRSEKFDKVVTLLWSYGDGILTYAATVFKKKDNKESWVKSVHRKQAMDRYINNPLRISLTCDQNMPEMSSTPVDWFISRYLIYQFGTHNTTSPDVRRVHHELKVRSDFNEHYDPFYKPERYILNGKTKEEEEVKGVSTWVYVFAGFISFPLISDILGNTFTKYVHLQ